MLFYFRKLKAYARARATYAHSRISSSSAKGPSNDKQNKKQNQRHLCGQQFVVLGAFKRKNLRDMLTNRSLRLAIDSIFSIILLFSDRIFILMMAFFMSIAISRGSRFWLYDRKKWLAVFTSSL